MSITRKTKLALITLVVMGAGVGWIASQWTVGKRVERLMGRVGDSTVSQSDRCASIYRLAQLVQNLPGNQGEAAVDLIAAQMSNSGMFVPRAAAQAIAPIAGRSPRAESVLIKKIQAPVDDATPFAIASLMVAYGAKPAYEDILLNVLRAPKAPSAWNEALNALAAFPKLGGNAASVLVNLLAEEQSISLKAAKLLMVSDPCNRDLLLYLQRNVRTAKGQFKYYLDELVARGKTSPCGSEYGKIMR